MDHYGTFQQKMQAHIGHMVYAVKMKKKSIYISTVCSSWVGSACMAVRHRE